MNFAARCITCAGALYAAAYFGDEPVPQTTNHDLPVRYQTLPLSDMEMCARWKSAIQASRQAGDTVISQTHALTFQTR
jgi:hypothetical protein